LPTHGAEADRALALVRHLGAATAGRAYDLKLIATDRTEAEQVLRGLPRPAVGLHCGARDDGRRIAPELLGRAAQTLGGGSFVVLGGAEERAVGGRLAAAVGDIPCRDLSGAVPLATAAAVVAGLDALLTTDSAPAHVAYAVGTPCVTMFVESDPRRWGPPVPGPHALLDCREGRGADPETLASAVRRVLDKR
jgi:ADP-heptose:LPS heptosyltransferase